MAHEVELADHIWQVLGQMSQAMGVDRRALVNQAVFNWARINGFSVPGMPPTAPAEEPANVRPFGTSTPASAATGPEPASAVAAVESKVAELDDAFQPAPPAAPDAVRETFVHADAVTMPETVQPAGTEVEAPPTAEPAELDEGTLMVVDDLLSDADLPTTGELTMNTLLPNEILEEMALEGAKAEAMAPPVEPAAKTAPVPTPVPKFTPASGSGSKGVLAPSRRNSEDFGAFDGATAVDQRLDSPIIPSPAIPGARHAVVPSLELRLEGGPPTPVDEFPFVIGRALDCNLVIDSAQASRAHAHILRERGGFIIEDRGSSNGTWYAGEKVSRREIHDGDVFLIGTHPLAFSISTR